ncbi:flavodoxin domain-containing protein [Streptomyces sp. TLI_146]|uniref:flavodoxin domain-containing protein n=1 Tax=Streptomyces sp. TLI_146 TaxID=1938858 RepID=UPI000C704FD7|nr:flavodoxin domain-containing protein [Streptomyces sp. TLI_146]PKV83159.1 menaquinone-dependent protoporphyrinogen oxidase [Streptomyces sp. TLI_146]
MSIKALVAYGSTNGSTAQIAERIGEVLREHGLDTEVRPAVQVGDVAPYDVVVIGGAVYAGRWHRDARRFARRNADQLSRKAVWLFSSGPLDASAAQRSIPPVAGARRAMAHLDAVEHRTFGGCLREGAKGRIARSLITSGRGGDFRDFDSVTAWAERIATQSSAHAPSPNGATCGPDRPAQEGRSPAAPIGPARRRREHTPEP